MYIQNKTKAMKAYIGKNFSWIMLTKTLDIQQNGSPIVHHLPIVDMYDKELGELSYVNSAVVSFIDNGKEYHYNANRNLQQQKVEHEVPTSTER